MIRLLPSHPRARRGLTMVETTLALLVLSGVVVSTLRVIEQIARVSVGIEDRQRAAVLATDLMDEILSMPVDAPSPRAAAIPGTRQTLQAVPEYNMWSESPPVTRAGLEHEGMGAYTRTVWVFEIGIGNDGLIRSASAGGSAYAIVVQVHRGDKLLAAFTAARTRAFDELVEASGS